MGTLLEIDDLRLGIRDLFGSSQILRGVNLSVDAGKIVGLVGESGCGKSMTARAILGLTPSNATSAGHVLFQGRDLLGLSERELTRVRGREISMIFQDPAAALNPLLTIGQQLTRVVKLHSSDRTEEPEKRVRSLLREVELGDPDGAVRLYPHQLSGGMQQRVMIAMALASSPRLLIADEPTTALDVTIQAQILALLKRLCADRDIAVLLITHDIGVIEQACSKVAVLYAGKVVEDGTADEVLARPKHPYTKALLAALPERAPPGANLSVLPGSVPGGRKPLPPCVFAARCPSAMDICWRIEPAYVPQAGGEVACWLYAKAQ